MPCQGQPLWTTALESDRVRRPSSTATGDLVLEGRGYDVGSRSSWRTAPYAGGALLIHAVSFDLAAGHQSWRHRL